MYGFALFAADTEHMLNVEPYLLTYLMNSSEKLQGKFWIEVAGSDGIFSVKNIMFLMMQASFQCLIYIITATFQRVQAAAHFEPKENKNTS